MKMLTGVIIKRHLLRDAWKSGTRTHIVDAEYLRPAHGFSDLKGGYNELLQPVKK